MILKNKKDIYPSAWAEVDLDAIRHNLKQLRKYSAKNSFVIPTRKETQKKLYTRQGLLPVIKASAYGHGMERVARLLVREKVDCLGVFHAQEGVRLREIGINADILLLESALKENIPAIVNFNLMPTVGTVSFAEALNAYAAKHKKNIKIHVKVDTGMGRLGVWHEDAFEFIQKIFELPNLVVYGIYTHFPLADTNKSFTQKQVRLLYDLVIKLDKSGMVIPFVHASNSMGLVGYRTRVLNLSRPGLMLYGLYPSPKFKIRVNLKPALSVKSRVSFLKTIKKGEGVSYGHTFVARKDTRVAILPIGYSDGYLRVFSNKASVLIRGVRCRVLGNVTMNQIIVDVSRVKKVTIGDLVIILGEQKKQRVTAFELAKYAQTINYEIVCSLGNSLPKIYREKRVPKTVFQKMLSLDLFTE